MDGAQKIVRRNFTFPANYDAKIEKLMRMHGAATKSELLRLALNRLEEAAEAKASSKETADA